MANLKRNMIELVKEVKAGEIETEKYLTPVFIPLQVVYEGLDLAEELGKNSLTAKETIDKLLDFVANKIYKKQFTKKELSNGLHGPDAGALLYEQLIFITEGYQSEETKNYLAKKN